MVASDARTTWETSFANSPLKHKRFLLESTSAFLAVVALENRFEGKDFCKNPREVVRNQV
jgi:hypothetical protein